VRGLAYRIHWRPERQPSHTGRFLWADQKNLKPVAALSMGLDYRPILLPHQLFRETVPLNNFNMPELSYALMVETTRYIAEESGNSRLVLQLQAIVARWFADAYH
jgi:hypothetical protein